MNLLPQKMPWGKYKGEYLIDIPVEYLEFIAQMDDVDPLLMESINRVIAWVRDGRTGSLNL